jgi:hypothetical protein
MTQEKYSNNKSCTNLVKNPSNVSHSSTSQKHTTNTKSPSSNQGGSGGKPNPSWGSVFKSENHFKSLHNC